MYFVTRIFLSRSLPLILRISRRIYGTSTVGMVPLKASDAACMLCARKQKIEGIDAAMFFSCYRAVLCTIRDVPFHSFINGIFSRASSFVCIM
jgi:hypothetical protein